MSKVNKILMAVFAVLIVAAIILVVNIHNSSSSDMNNPGTQPAGSVSGDIADGDQIIADAFKNKKSDIPVQGQGTVVKLLADDTEGNEHQKFIIELSSGQSLLVAHNISISEKIKDLKEGDLIRFAGEYVWNDEGGLIHWTHHDPSKKHTDGWLEHNGKTYN